MSRHLVTAVDGTGEAEPVLVDTDQEGAVVFELDTGERLEFDERELLSANRRSERTWLSVSLNGSNSSELRPCQDTRKTPSRSVRATIRST